MSANEDIAALRSIAYELISIQYALEDELIHCPAGGTTYSVVDDAISHTTAAIELLYNEADALTQWPYDQ
jgi:hypothetical protein